MAVALTSRATAYSARRRSSDAMALAATSLGASLGVVALAVAYAAGRAGTQLAWLYWVGEVFIFAPFAFLAAIKRPGGRGFYQVAAAIFAVMTYLSRFLYSPTRVRFWDELQHWRAVENAANTGRIGSANLALPIESHFPALQSAAVVVRETLGVSSDAAGFAVAAVSHLALILVLLATFERFGLGWRAAFIGVLVYAANAEYIGLTEMFVYETIALPFCVATLYFVRPPTVTKAPRALALTLASAVMCIISHHLTAIFMVVVLWILALDDLRLNRQRFRVLSAPAAIIATALEAAWFSLDAPSLTSYVAPYTSGLLAPNVTSLQPRAGYKQLATASLPAFDYVAQRVGVVIIAAAVILLIIRLIQSPRYRARASAAMVAMAVAYVALIPLSIYGGRVGEVINRLVPFVFIGVGASVAYLFDVAPARRRADARTSHFAWTPLVGVGLVVLYVGGVASSFPAFWGRLPGPYLAYGFDRGVDEQTLTAADWVKNHVPSGSEFTGDGNALHVVGPIGNQRSSYTGVHLFFLSEFPGNVTPLIQRQHLDYVWLDRRLVSAAAPYGKIFTGNDGVKFGARPTRADVQALLKLKNSRVVYDDGTIAIVNLQQIRGR